MTEQTEIWKPIQTFEGMYEASNLGRIKAPHKISSDGRVFKERILKLHIDNGGYVKVGLRKNNETKIYFVHRLVMFAFIGFSNLQVDHINTLKSDNRLINLRYCTNRENSHWASLRRKKYSIYTGATWHKTKKVWESQMTYDSKHYYMGAFNCETAAHFAYLKKLRELQAA